MVVGIELFSSEIVNHQYQDKGEHHAAYHRGQPLLPIKEIESFKREKQQTVYGYEDEGIERIFHHTQRTDRGAKVVGIVLLYEQRQEVGLQQANHRH